ncbi:hypothetical protein BSKO_02535 [Bryopsis sp. KO-2023]|nr:hypothetical protein BSKO_02535 [Bryopsis sp. KO-2023]
MSTEWISEEEDMETLVMKRKKNQEKSPEEAIGLHKEFCGILHGGRLSYQNKDGVCDARAFVAATAAVFAPDTLLIGQFYRKIKWSVAFISRKGLGPRLGAIVHVYRGNIGPTKPKRPLAIKTLMRQATDMVAASGLEIPFQPDTMDRAAIM